MTTNVSTAEHAHPQGTMNKAIVIAVLLCMLIRRIKQSSSLRRIARRREFMRRIIEERRRRLIHRQNLVKLFKTSTERSCWCVYRSRQWWLAASNGLFGEQWWRDNLRMSYDTFTMLTRCLRPHIQKQDTHLRKAIPVEERVAITIWRLSTNVEYRTLSALFGVGISTVCTIVLETCSAICQHLMPLYVSMPIGVRLQEVVDGFQTQWGFPQVVGAIDGSHIPIVRPSDSAADYYNRKSFFSVIVQGVVDYQGQFIDAYIGWPGKLHDARVFHNSSFYRKGLQGILVHEQMATIEGVKVPLLVLGDPAYPLLPWLMKPYPDTGNLTTEEKHFNYRQSRARMVVENAFGRLKGRWRCLMKRLDCHIDHVPCMVGTCITLHNICERFGDNCSIDWIENDTMLINQQDNTQTVASSNTSSNTTTTPSNQATSIRRALTIHLSKQ